MGEGEYIVLIRGELRRFTHWDQIPEQFGNLIKFLPAIPPGPHTHEQHEELERMTEIFRGFLARECKCLQ